MILNIPFYDNDGDGNQCMQACMQSVIKYFLNKDFSLEELDAFTERKPNMWSYTSQMIPFLYDLGLDLLYYSKDDVSLFLEGESYIRKNYGKDAEVILKHTDIATVIKSTKRLLNNGCFK